jgi:multiple sugar transport system permease protein
MKYKTQTSTLRFLVYLVLVIVALLCIVPIWILFVNATRTTPEIRSGISLLPGNNLAVNYNILAGRGLPIASAFFNSMYISVFSTIAGVYFSILTAYGIEVYDFKGRRFFRRFIYVVVLVPMQTSIIGFYQYCAALGLLNSYIPLIVPAAASAGSVFFAMQYLESCIIKDLIAAARIDGCSEIGIFHRIMMPIASPGMFTMAIFAFVASWNNFFTPFILISDMKRYTFPMLVQTLKGNMYQTELGGVYCGLALSVLPVVVVYSLFAKYIVNGISMGAVKE